MKYIIELGGAFPELVTKFRKKILSDPSTDESFIKAIIHSAIVDYDLDYEKPRCDFECDLDNGVTVHCTKYQGHSNEHTIKIDEGCF